MTVIQLNFCVCIECTRACIYEVCARFSTRVAVSYCQWSCCLHHFDARVTSVLLDAFWNLHSGPHDYTANSLNHRAISSVHDITTFKETFLLDKANMLY